MSKIAFHMQNMLNDGMYCQCILKQLEKLRLQLAEAEAALEVRKKPPEDTGPKIVGEGLVIDEWVIHLHLNN